MQKIKQNSQLTLIIVLFVVLLNVGCSLSFLKQPSNTVIEVKPQETIFTVVNTADPESPTLTTSIQMPFSVNRDNNVVLSENHAYVTTDNHLHTIDVTTPQQPVYLKSLEFENQIGKVVVFNNLLVVGSQDELHFIDISIPSQPALHVTKHLTNRNPIDDFDVWDSFVFVMGKNNTLYIFERDDDQLRHIRTAKMSDQRWMLYPKNSSQMVEQVKYPSYPTYPHELSQGLLFDHYFLQIKSSGNASVRSSSAFVGVSSLDRTSGLIMVYNAGYVPRGTNPRSPHTGSIHVDIQWDCSNYFSSQRELTTTHRNSDHTNQREESKDLQNYIPVSSNGTIDYKDKQFLGSITDFQISGNLLYVLNEKGYLSILWLPTVEDDPYLFRPDFLSLTSLQGNHPKSIAVGEDNVYLIATPKSTQSGFAKQQ